MITCCQSFVLLVCNIFMHIFKNCFTLGRTISIKLGTKHTWVKKIRATPNSREDSSEIVNIHYEISVENVMSSANQNAEFMDVALDCNINFV